MLLLGDDGKKIENPECEREAGVDAFGERRQRLVSISFFRI